MDEQRLTTLMRELYDEGGSHRAPPFSAAEMPPRPRLSGRWSAVAGAAVAAAVVVSVVTLTNTSNDTSRLVPVEGPTTTTTATPSPSSSPAPSPTPAALPSPADSPLPGVYPPTGIYSQGPQISGMRWMNLNAWQDRLTPTTYLSVYAGGATIDPSLQSDATYAAVLVITPMDSYKFDHNQVALNAIGTIYRPPGNPMGKLQVSSASGNLVSLTLVGTTQTYTFDDVTMTFR